MPQISMTVAQSRSLLHTDVDRLLVVPPPFRRVSILWINVCQSDGEMHQEQIEVFETPQFELHLRCSFRLMRTDFSCDITNQAGYCLHGHAHGKCSTTTEGKSEQYENLRGSLSNLGCNDLTGKKSERCYNAQGAALTELITLNNALFQSTPHTFSGFFFIAVVPCAVKETVSRLYGIVHHLRE